MAWASGFGVEGSRNLCNLEGAGFRTQDTFQKQNAPSNATLFGRRRFLRKVPVIQ